MPTPREAYMNTVEAAPLSGQRVATADYGAAGEIIGRAAQGFGQNVQQVGQDLDDIRTMQAVSDTKKADTAYMIGAAAITSGYQQLEKGDATAARTKALADLDELGTAQRAELKDNRARQMFDEQFQRRKAEAALAIDGHFRKEAVAESDESSASRETALLITAVDAPDDETMFNNIHTAIGERTSRMRGASPEAKALASYDLRSGALAAKAQSIRDPIAQDQFRQKYSRMISPDDEVKLIRANEAGLTDADAAFSDKNFGVWVAGGKNPALIQTPGSQVTHVDETGAEPPPAALVAPAPSAASANRPAAAAPRATTAVVKGAHYSPTHGIGRRTDGVKEHLTRGRVAIDEAAPIGTAIYVPVRGKVIAAPQTQQGANGFLTRVEYGDGVVVTYIHQKTASPHGEGKIVESSQVLGLVGNTGRVRSSKGGNGAHVDYSVTQNGKPIDPDKVVYRSYSGSGESSTSKLDQYKPDDADTTQLVADVHQYAQLRGMSDVQERTLLRNRMEVVNFNRGLQQDKERRATRTANEWLVAHGEGTFRLSDVPGYAEMGPEGQQTFIQIQEVRSRPVPIEKGGKAHTLMRLAEIEDPEEFLKKNPFAMPMHSDEQADMAVRQAKMREERKNGGGAFDNRSRIKQSADLYMYRVPGIVDNVDTKAEKALRIEYYDYMGREVARAIARNGGKDIPAREYDEIAAEAAISVVVKGKKVPYFQARGKTADHIAKADLAKIAWRRVNPGQPVPSDAWFEQQVQGR